ncbi:Uncharacterised protein [Mycobacteroides abscessus subsp. abscessus]|nr:Uncharacterised protein [Mycobacteroides abscessus subsp. abscessus]
MGLGLLTAVQGGVGVQLQADRVPAPGHPPHGHRQVRDRPRADVVHARRALPEGQDGVEGDDVQLRTEQPGPAAPGLPLQLLLAHQPMGLVAGQLSGHLPQLRCRAPAGGHGHRQQVRRRAPGARGHPGPAGQHAVHLRDPVAGAGQAEHPGQVGSGRRDDGRGPPGPGGLPRPQQRLLQCRVQLPAGPVGHRRGVRGASGQGVILPLLQLLQQRLEGLGVLGAHRDVVGVLGGQLGQARALRRDRVLPVQDLPVDPAQPAQGVEGREAVGDEVVEAVQQEEPASALDQGAAHGLPGQRLQGVPQLLGAPGQHRLADRLLPLPVRLIPRGLGGREGHRAQHLDAVQEPLQRDLPPQHPPVPLGAAHAEPGVLRVHQAQGPLQGGDVGRGGQLHALGGGVAGVLRVQARGHVDAAGGLGDRVPGVLGGCHRRIRS